MKAQQLRLPGVKRARGRPRKPDALSPAQRVARYRRRRQKHGERDIHIWLPRDLWRDLKRKAKETGQQLEEIAANAIVRGLR